MSKKINNISLQKVILFLACFSMALSIGLGAFGAHALSAHLSVKQNATYQTAVQYQIYHSLALLALGIIMCHFQHALFTLSGILLLIGIVLFSGSLYLLVLLGGSSIGMITPIGGLAFILGWGSLGIGCVLVESHHMPVNTTDTIP